MSNFETFSNIYELMDYTYGKGHSVLNMVQKDAPVLTSTTGVFNAVYGAMAFSQLNNEANVFAALPKYPWQHSGYRAITANATSIGYGGYTEAGALPATIKPTFAQIDVTVKEVSHTFDVSWRQQMLVKSGDDAFGDMAQNREYAASKHALDINAALCLDITTLPQKQFESIDRVTGATSLVTQGLADAADEDIYGIDRSSGGSWADAQVSSNSGTDRVLTLKLVEDVLALTRAAGGRTNVILTGHDTMMRIHSLMQNSVRYQGLLTQGAAYRVGVNGVETEEGTNFGIRVSEIYGIPVITSNSVTKDTISRIYFLDTTMAEGTGIPRLGFALLQPTLYAEAGMGTSNPNPFVVDGFRTEGIFYTCGELVCTFLAAQGSLRDLK